MVLIRVVPSPNVPSPQIPAPRFSGTPPPGSKRRKFPLETLHIIYNPFEINAC
jgi:hypothetical protein